MTNASTPVSSSDAPGKRSLHYDDFFGPLFFEPYAIEVAKRITALPVLTVLEIAAGTGRVTRHIRENIAPSAKFIASDLSDDMLAVAKNKLGHLDIEWQIIDAQQLPFDENSVDLVICCFGYMFVPDKPKAFVEAYRVLKPGGLFLFTTWDKLENNAASFCSVSVAKKYLDEPLPESHFLATSMSDGNVIQSLVRDAGFSDVSIEKVERLSVCASAKEAAFGFVEGGSIYGEIKRRNPEMLDGIRLELENTFAEQFGAAPMIAPISAIVAEAWK